MSDDQPIPRKHLNKTFVFENLQELESEEYQNDVFQNCIIYVKSPTGLEPFSLKNDGVKLLNTMVIKRQETPSSDMTPFVLGFTEPNQSGISECVYTSGDRHSLLENTFKNLTNNFYCPSSFKASDEEVFTGQLYHITSLDFASYFYFQREQNIRIEYDADQTIEFRDLSQATFDFPYVVVKEVNFNVVIKSLPAHTISFLNDITIDGEIKEGTTLDADNILIKTLNVKTSCLKNLKTTGVKKISFINGALKFFNSSGNEIPVQFELILNYNAKFDASKIKADKICGGNMILL